MNDNLPHRNETNQERTSETSRAAGIAGLCFLAGALIVPLAYAFGYWRIYAPVLREWIYWLIGPQFVLGMFFMAFLVSLCAFALSLGRPNG